MDLLMWRVSRVMQLLELVSVLPKEPLPFFTIPFRRSIHRHDTYFNPWKLLHIVPQNNHTFPSCFYLLNTRNDSICPTPWNLSIPLQLPLGQSNQL